MELSLEKYRRGRSEPILIGSEKLLKPALKLMSFYRLRIDQIKMTRGPVITGGWSPLD